ncbi:MAG: arylamine N-acetyltransferase family protein [Woeseiaceae bacterium]
MNLPSYLHRIGFGGSVQPSSDTLAALLRCHVLTIPFENLDVQLGIPVTTAAEAAFEKIVGRERGGWCYEQNGLFGWALSEVGFEVTRVAAAVHRDDRGTAALANHLCLLVRTPDNRESVYLADVGFGGSMLEPIRLETSQHDQAPFRIGLRMLDDGYWRFKEESGTDTVSYDFLAEPGDEAAMSEKCEQLQTNPDSSFVLSFVAQKRATETHISLRGRVLTVVTATSKETRTLQSRDEFAETLKNQFQLDVADAASLWPKILERHKVLFGA